MFALSWTHQFLLFYAVKMHELKTKDLIINKKKTISFEFR